MRTAAIYRQIRSAISMGIMATALLAAACTRASCDNRAFYGLPSPDGKYIAFIFHRTCPGLEGVTTQVSLMPFHDSLRSDAGNVLSVAGEQPVKVSWHGPTTLWVAGFNAAVYERHEPLDGISVEYH